MFTCGWIWHLLNEIELLIDMGDQLLVEFIGIENTKSMKGIPSEIHDSKIR